MIGMVPTLIQLCIISRPRLCQEVLIPTSSLGASKGEGYSEQTNRKFKQLSNLGSMVCMPFYLAFLDYAQEKDLNEDTIYKVLDIIENYWARRIICGYPANVMAKSFALLHSDIRTLRVLASLRPSAV